MANTLSLRNRIKTAQNVSKTTRAMQMIAVSKLKKAQDAALGSRPYTEKLTGLSQNLSTKLEPDKLHPYMKKNNSDKTLIIVLSPDKGLCGGLITNIAREILTLKDQDFTFINIGKKTEGLLSRLNKNIIAAFEFGNTLPSFEMVYPIEKIITESFISGKVSSVKILYTHFSSFFSQTPKMQTLLPIIFAEQNEIDEEKKLSNFELFEPNIEELLPSLLEHSLQMSLYQYLLESFLSEQAARMFAMQNATNNAKEIISELKLEYNKIRQESITNELLDITSGAFINYA